MWHDMFAQEIPTWEKILRTVLVYLLIAVLLRLAGKRALAGMNSLDLVVMLLLSNVVQNAIIGPDNSVTGAALGAAVLIAVNAVCNRLAYASAFFSQLFDGTETTLVSDGTVDRDALRRNALRTSELEHALRTQGADSPDEIARAVLEPAGHLVVDLKADQQSATHGDIEKVLAELRAVRELLAAR